MNTFKIKATVITPISIGNDLQLSPYKDYFISENKVHYIDERKLGDLLAKQESLMDEYVEGVANMEGNRSQFDIESFFRGTLSTNPAEIVRNSVDFKGDAFAKLPINGFIKHPNGQPYIPGSSIKGAIKTALVYTDLEKTDFGDKWKRSFFQQLERIDFNRRVNERFLQGKLKGQLDELEELLKKKAETKSNLGVIERLTVSDSCKINKKQLEVIDLKRTQIPVRQEVLKINSNFYFTISSPGEGWESLGEKLNRFAFNNLSEFQDNRKEVLNQIDKSFDKNHAEIFLPLGFGKGIYLNSMLLSLKDYAYDNGKEKVYERYLNILFPKIKEINIDSFPTTAFQTFKGNLSLGWIKLEKTD